MTLFHVVFICLYAFIGNIVALAHSYGPHSRSKEGFWVFLMSYLLIVIFWPIGLLELIDEVKRYKKRR